MNRISIKIFSFFLLLSCIVFGCKKLDSFEVYTLTDFDAEFAVPLFTTDFTLSDLVENFDDSTNVSYSSDGLLIFTYRGESVARSSDEIFKVLDTINGVPLPFMDTLTALPFIPPNGVIIDRAIIKSGFISTWGFTSDHEENVTVTMTFPSLIKDGQPLEASMSREYTGELPVFGFSLVPIELDGYELDVINDSVYVQFRVFREESGIVDTMASAVVQFFEVRASYVEGYLGNEVYEFDQDTILIDAFDNLNQGDVTIVDPKINILIENSFGFPVRAYVKTLNIFTKDNQVIPLQGAAFDTGIDFNYPSLDEVGESKITKFSFDKTNSNIVEVIGSGPKAVDYDFEAIPNPDNNTSIRGFLTDTSSFLAEVEVELPIFGTLADFGVFDTLQVDTFDFDVDLQNYGEADYAEFKLVTVNEIPMDIDLQLYFVDINGRILDSLFQQSERIILAAPVDAAGVPIQPTRKETFSTMENERFERLTQTKQLYLKSTFSTLDAGVTNVQLRGNQRVDIGMGLKLGVTSK